jgi:uncharacterized membrane protein YoaK (UPF0700 family)
MPRPVTRRPMAILMLLALLLFIAGAIVGGALLYLRFGDRAYWALFILGPGAYFLDLALNGRHRRIR